MASFIDPLLEEPRQAPAGLRFEGALEVRGDDFAPLMATRIRVQRAPERLVADEAAQHVQHQRPLLVDVAVVQLEAILVVDVIDDWAAAPGIRGKVALEVLPQLDAKLVLAQVVLGPHGLEVGRERLF